MTDATLHQALAYARRGWPVFPCLPSQKIPATGHGYLDATTDEQQITAWFGHGQRPAGRGRHPAAAARPARHGPRLGPHRPRHGRQQTPSRARRGDARLSSSPQLRDGSRRLYDAWGTSVPERSPGAPNQPSARPRPPPRSCRGTGAPPPLYDHQLDILGYRPLRWLPPRHRDRHHPHPPACSSWHYNKEERRVNRRLRTTWTSSDDFFGLLDQRGYTGGEQRTSTAGCDLLLATWRASTRLPGTTRSAPTSVRSSRGHNPCHRTGPATPRAGCAGAGSAGTVSTASTRRWSSGPLSMCSFWKMLADVLLDRVLGDDELGGDAVVGAAFGHQLEDFALAWGELGERVVVAVQADELCDDGRVDRGAAFGDAADGGAELVDVRDAVLEQVADAARRRREEIHRVAELDVLGEHEHRDARGSCARICFAGADAFVAVGRAACGCR